MSQFIVIVALLVAALVLYRRHWMHKVQPRVYTADFEGQLFRAGETVIAIRKTATPATRTVICFPGFLEDMRYFQALYQDVDCQLILLNNAAYHCPFDSDNVQELDWDTNPHPCGTIEYDGFHLAHALKHLATGSEIVLHGHSRGGAVVLEAGRQFPQWTRVEDKEVAAVLEAAVLPGAKTAGKGSAPMVHRIICFLLPVVLGLSRKADPEKVLKQPMMRPTNPLKTALCQSVYFLPKQYSTCVTNVHSIWLWQQQNDAALYANFAQVSVLVGERDDVLDNPSMIASAEQGAQGNSRVEIVHTKNTNHFISLEQPQYIMAL